MLMETNTITYLARFIYRIRYKLFLGSIITCLLTIYFTKILPKNIYWYQPLFIQILFPEEV